MTTLTYTQIYDLWHEYEGIVGFALAIEQAVLQSLRVRKENRHLDDMAVDQFAASMKTKLAKKRAEGRGGWQDMSASELSQLLHEHVDKGDPLDVANFCMMLHENGQTIMQSPEMQALRKDAERYRWLRDSESDDMGVVTGIEGIDYGSTSVAYTYEDGLCGEQLDKAIDAAMEKQK